MANYSTPGVYVEEISTFPATVVRVATAVPVFIGYTELSGSAVNNIPTKVGSLVEYEALFGGEPTTYGRDITVTLDASGVATNVELELDYYLYHALRHFYANGGGDAYIMSVGAYSNSGPDKATLIAALTVLEKEDEPTLILIPDAFGFTASNLGDVQEQMLAHCSKMQDRFAILDVIDTGVENTDATAFRTEVGANNMKNGAAYYPALATSIGPNGDIDVEAQVSLLDSSNVAITLEAFAGGGPDESLEDYYELLRDQGLLADPQPVYGPTTKTWASCISDWNADYVASMPLTGGTAATRDAAAVAKLTNLIRTLGRMAQILYAYSGEDFFENDALDLAKETIVLDANPGLRDQVEALFILHQTLDNANVTSGTPTALAIMTDDDFGTNPPVADYNYSLDTLVLTGTNQYDLGAAIAEVSVGYNNAIDNLLAIYNALKAMYESLTGIVATSLTVIGDLNVSSSVYAGIVQSIRNTGYTLPPCGAMAGVYASVDAARGVWKAPANVSLNAVRDVRKLSGTELDDLNVSAGTGKSINAIRLFTGQGILVYGARTLAGNDNEWRYIPVRRLFIMVEESVRKAMEPMVFEPNDANTWVKVKGMVESFLNGLWRDGALAGGTPEAAFFVKVGLGQTMTAQDILEGKLIVEIGMAAVRPAEFIVLKFSHMLQTS